MSQACAQQSLNRPDLTPAASRAPAPAGDALRDHTHVADLHRAAPPAAAQPAAQASRAMRWQTQAQQSPPVNISLVSVRTQPHALTPQARVCMPRTLHLLVAQRLQRLLRTTKVAVRAQPGLLRVQQRSLQRLHTPSPNRRGQRRERLSLKRRQHSSAACA